MLMIKTDKIIGIVLVFIVILLLICNGNNMSKKIEVLPEENIFPSYAFDVEKNERVILNYIYIDSSYSLEEKIKIVPEIPGLLCCPFIKNINRFIFQKRCNHSKSFALA